MGFLILIIGCGRGDVRYTSFKIIIGTDELLDAAKLPEADVSKADWPTKSDRSIVNASRGSSCMFS